MTVMLLMLLAAALYWMSMQEAKESQQYMSYQPLEA
jgi:hypothetical protein